MMLSPNGYIEDFKDADYNTLIMKRDELIAYIVDYEKKEKAGDRSGHDWMMRPNAQVRYQMYLEYIAEICKLMHQRYNEDYVWGDKSLSDA